MDSSTEDEQGPAVKHPKKASKSPEFVDTDPSTSLLLPVVKHPQKTPKTPHEDPQKTSPGLMHKESTKPAKKIPVASCTHILTSDIRKDKQCRQEVSDKTDKFCKYHKRQT